MSEEYNPFEPPESPLMQSFRVGNMIRERAEARHALTWRTGRTVRLNVYEGDRPVCQCHGESDARRIVAAMNFARAEGFWGE